MRRVTTLLLLVATIGTATTWWLQRLAAAELRREIASARGQTDALARLRSANAQLAASLPSPAEFERLRSDRAALSRLRDEVDATRAKIEQRERARQASGNPAPRKPLPGTESPAAVAQTVHRAIAGGDPDTLATLIDLASDAGSVAQQALTRIPLLKRSRYPSPERLVAELMCAATPGAGERVLSSTELPGSQGVPSEISNNWRAKARTLVTTIQTADGRVREDRQVYLETADGWRWVVSRDLLTKRLVEAGLMPPPAAIPASGG
jgi:hypothetical protein